jgi:dihydrofolate reductase
VNKISITLGAKTVRLARLVICSPSKIRSRCDPASSKLDDAPWGDFPAATVTRDPAATVRELKEQGGKDILLWGSLKLMHSLLDAGIVDEVRMLVCPASRGKGTRIFEDRQDLKLVEATSFENGVALLRYEIKR